MENTDIKNRTTENAPADAAGHGQTDLRQSLIIVLCSILLLTASLGFIYEYRSTETRLDGIEQKNLSVLAESIDHSIYLLLSRSQSNLTHIAGEGDAARELLEQNLLENGEHETLAAVIRSTLKQQSTLFTRILVRNGDEILCSTLTNDPLDYRIRGESAENRYAFVQSERDSFYLAVSTEPKENGLIYTGLIPVEDLYSNITAGSVSRNFWLVLYDRTGDLILQNNASFPLCMEMSREDALARKDGIARLVQCDDEGERNTVSSQYDSDGDGKLNPVLSACIPAILSEN